MKDTEQHLSDLAQIRSMMERSSRFMSLSGLSGVFAGLWALIGAAIAYYWIKDLNQSYSSVYSRRAVDELTHMTSQFTLLGIGIIIAALLSGIFFTTRKAKKLGQKIWDNSSRQMLVNIFIPLIVGGLFCLFLAFEGYYKLIAPSTLIFYGLALINGSKYTFNDIRNLGLFEVVLGLICLLKPGLGLFFWAAGFGILHILYGITMYYKYER